LAKDFEISSAAAQGRTAEKPSHKRRRFKARSVIGHAQKNEVALSADGRGGSQPRFVRNLASAISAPIDGHNLPLLISTLEFAKTCDHPIVITSAAEGQGLKPA